MKSSVDSVVASEERSRLIRRVRTSLRSRLLRGLYPGARAPYGLARQLVDIASMQSAPRSPDGGRAGGTAYRLVHATDGTAGVVQQIFAWAERGESMQRIAERLNESGTPSPRGRARAAGAALPWSADGVRAILNNSIYTGRLIWGGSPDVTPAALRDVDLMKHEGAVVVEGMVTPPLVDADQWSRVQGLLAGTRERHIGRRRGRPSFLLSALLTCAHCGAPFSGHTSTSQEANQRRYYKHSRSLEPYKDCPTRRTYLRVDAMDALVSNQIERWLDDDALATMARDELDRLLGAHGGPDQVQQQRHLEQRIAEAEVALHRAAQLAAQTSDVTLQATYERVAEEHAAVVTQCRAELALLSDTATHLERARQRIEERRRAWLQPLTLWREADVEQRKEILRALLLRIDVDLDGGTATMVVPTP
jgi:hypothetical protein